MNENINIIYIYALFDPRKPLHIRYVGKTIHLEKRIANHIKSPRYKEKNYKINWINSLIKNNIYPEYKILEECNTNNWKEKEMHWIKKLREEGHILTNSTAGGDGCNEPTEELRKKLSESHKGNKSRLGIPHTEKTKKHFSKIRKGRKGTYAERQRFIEYNKKKRLRL